MKKLLLIVILVNNFIFAQNNKITDKKKQVTKYFKISKNYVYCVNTLGNIDIWNITEEKKIDSIKINDTIFSCVTKDNNGNIYFGTRNSNIYKVNNGKLDLFLNLNTEIKEKVIHHIYFNSKDELFIVHNGGIYSPSKNKTWSEFDQRGSIVSRGKKNKDFFMLPDYIYKDKDGVLWMSKSYGEWGSSSHRFNIEKEMIIKNKEGSYISSDYIFEDNSDKLYGTNGSMHFFQRGSIDIIEGNKIIKNINIIRINENEIKGGNNKKEVVLENSLMLGPGTYNEFNGKYYFSSTNGIYEAELNNNEFINFTQFLKLKLNWKQEPLAIGVAMSYKELKFIEKGKLLILTSNNGLALYYDKNIKWLN